MMLLSLVFGLATLAAPAEDIATETVASPPVIEMAKPSEALNSEKSIQVHLEPNIKATGENSNPLSKALFAVLIISALAGGAYFLIGKYKRVQLKQNSAPEIKVLRQHYLAPKKSLAIIRVAGESILIGVTDQNINLIKSLSLLDDDVPEDLPTNDFRSSLDNAAPKTFKTNTQKSEKAESETDDFSISGIKDFVNTRLKNMRNLN